MDIPDSSIQPLITGLYIRPILVRAGIKGRKCFLCHPHAVIHDSDLQDAVLAAGLNTHGAVSLLGLSLIHI